MNSNSADRLEAAYQQAAEVIRQSEAIFIGAGAGMGVDSGLPDFRGNQGFWQAYPRFAKLKLSFSDLANPIWFEKDVNQAWGFYGHRYNMYCNTTPHKGFNILLDWVKQKPFGGFVFTSNVDGHFQKAGFDAKRIYECHGSINYLQCNQQCRADIWEAKMDNIEVDEAQLTAREPLPRCPHCNQIARPNILMFSDWDWLPQRSDTQSQRMTQWLSQLQSKQIAVIEIGAGTAIPTVRMACEQVAQRSGARLIRINPRECLTSGEGIAIADSGLNALESIAKLV